MVESVRFSIYNIIPSANSDRFTSSIPNCMPVIFFSFLIVLARTSNTMLNKNGESEYLCLIPYLRGNAFNFSPLSMILAVHLLHMALLCSGMFLLCPFC